MDKLGTWSSVDVQTPQKRVHGRDGRERQILKVKGSAFYRAMSRTETRAAMARTEQS